MPRATSGALVLVLILCNYTFGASAIQIIEYPGTDLNATRGSNVTLTFTFGNVNRENRFAVRFYAPHPLKRNYPLRLVYEQIGENAADIHDFRSDYHVNSKWLNAIVIQYKFTIIQIDENTSGLFKCSLRDIPLKPQGGFVGDPINITVIDRDVPTEPTAARESTSDMITTQSGRDLEASKGKVIGTVVAILVTMIAVVSLAAFLLRKYRGCQFQMRGTTCFQKDQPTDHNLDQVA